MGRIKRTVGNIRSALRRVHQSEPAVWLAIVNLGSVLAARWGFDLDVDSLLLWVIGTTSATTIAQRQSVYSPRSVERMGFDRSEPKDWFRGEYGN